MSSATAFPAVQLCALLVLGSGCGSESADGAGGSAAHGGNGAGALAHAGQSVGGAGGASGEGGFSSAAGAGGAGAGGAGGNSAGALATSGAGAAANSGMSGMSGSSGANAGSGPESGTPTVVVRGSGTRIEDVDLTLGGLNQDLPAPSMDCLTRQDLVVGCMAVSGTYNGSAFDFFCDDGSATTAMLSLSAGDGPRLARCKGPVGDDNLVVALLLGAESISAPTHTFSAEAASSGAYVNIWQIERKFQSYPDGTYALAATHDQTFKTAGLSEFAMNMDWRVDASFALSLTPKSRCTQATGCDALRLRASLRVFPR